MYLLYVINIYDSNAYTIASKTLMMHDSSTNFIAIKFKCVHDESPHVQFNIHTLKTSILPGINLICHCTHASVSVGKDSLY